MPRRKALIRKTKKRTFRKKRSTAMKKYKKARTIVYWNLTGPQAMKFHLRFSDGINIALYAAATTINAKRWFANSLFQIERTGSSASTIPGFVDLRPLFNYYQVTYSKIRVQFANTEGSPVLVGIIPWNIDPGAAITQATARLYQDNPQCITTTMGEAPGAEPKTLKMGMPISRIIGRKISPTDTSFSAGMSNTGGASAPLASPTDVCYWQVFGYTLNGINFANLTGIAIQVTIDLYGHMYERQYEAA